MRSDSPRWQQMTPSAFAWERAALEHVKGLLPDAEPYRAWANFEFVADDGTVNEVDLLVACPRGLFLVEIKSRPGRLTGDAGTWTWRGDRVRTEDNPLLLTNRKAKKLKSMLERVARSRRARVPFLQAVCCCTARASTSSSTTRAAPTCTAPTPTSRCPGPARCRRSARSAHGTA